VISFNVKYHGPEYEVALCGHGTIAAMKVILDSATNLPGFGQESKFPVFSSPETHTVEFTTINGVVLSARKVVIPDEMSGKGEDWIEIVLPAGKLKELPTAEEERVLGILTRAMGKDPKVRYIGAGEPPFQQDLLIVLNESENIEQLKLDPEVLVGETQVRCLHLPRLTPLVENTEGNRVRKAHLHHRFDERRIPNGLHHQDVRSRCRSRRRPRLRFRQLHHGSLLGSPERHHGADGQAGQREGWQVEGGGRWR